MITVFDAKERVAIVCVTQYLELEMKSLLLRWWMVGHALCHWHDLQPGRWAASMHFLDYYFVFEAVNLLSRSCSAVAVGAVTPWRLDDDDDVRSLLYAAATKTSLK